MSVAVVNLLLDLLAFTSDTVFPIGIEAGLHVLYTKVESDVVEGDGVAHHRIEDEVMLSAVDHLRKDGGQPCKSGCTRDEAIVVHDRDFAFIVKARV